MLSALAWRDAHVPQMLAEKLGSSLKMDFVAAVEEFDLGAVANLRGRVQVGDPFNLAVAYPFVDCADRAAEPFAIGLD